MKSMMDQRMPIGKGAGVEGEVAGALIIVSMMKGTKDSNVCFLEAFSSQFIFRGASQVCVCFPLEHQ